MRGWGSRTRRHAGGRPSRAASTAWVVDDGGGAREVEESGVGLSRGAKTARHSPAAGVCSFSGTCTVIASARVNRSSSDSACSTLEDSCQARLHRELRVVAEHPHPQCQGGVRPPRRRWRPGPRLRARVRVARSPRSSSCPAPPPPRWPRHRPRVRAREQPRRPRWLRGRQQQAREHQLLDRVGVGARRVEHRNCRAGSSPPTGMLLTPAPGTGRWRARPGATPKAVQVGGAHQESRPGRVTPGAHFRSARRRQSAPGPRGADVVERERMR